ncbi:MAG: cytochrome C oxidase subunit IV family protein [Planctomycetaceae bacterium]|nr:cytochrome C oxidase subunit IV family protein [Planctomycetaceae bacterium]
MSHSEESHGEDHGFAHAMPVRTLLAVFVALVSLTCLTVWTASFSFGEFDLVLAMVIATIKATLVMMFFMHLIQDKRLNVLVFLSAFLFAALFIGFTLMDKDAYNPNIDETFSDTHSRANP